MGVIVHLGRLSDRLTERLLRMQSASASAELARDRQGFIRRAQFSAIMAISQPMMIANIGNALALVALEHYLGKLELLTLLWAVVVLAFAVLGYVNAGRLRSAAPRNTASVRAPGKIALSSLMLAVIWCYPLIFILPEGDLLEAAFISALTAGMVAGGALALYPVPLAGFIYITILSCVAFLMIVSTDALPPLPFGLVISGFGLVVAFSVRRHTGMFLSELVGKLDAERQRDMVNLLLDTYQGEGGQYLWRCDKCLNLTTAPDTLFLMFNLEPTKVRTTNLIELFHSAGAVAYDAQSSAAYSAIETLSDTAEANFEMTLRIQGGRILKLAGRRETGECSDRLGYLGYLKDVTMEVHATEKVYHLATRDTMTGLLNYREFIKRAATKLEASNRELESSTETDTAHFLFLDADNLKTVNDNFGHAIGDRLIEKIAARLRDLMPQGSLLARKGGDEFVALFLAGNQVDATTLSAALMKGINRSFHYGEMEIPVSCCIGISKSESRTASLQTLELEADRALYFAKSQGKRQVRFYEKAIGQQIRRDRTLALKLEEAIKTDGLSLVFQPIVNLDTGEILGAEALLRWEHATFGAVSPEKTVAIAQAEGLGLALAEYVVLQASIQAKKWRPDCFVSVNLHSTDLQRGNFSQRVKDILKQTRFPPDRLWLEVTESESLRNSEDVQNNLNSLRAAGVRIAIDDFGAGYSSLSYLNFYPSDIIKIDKSIVRNCHRNDSNKIIVKALKSLATLSGFQVVAEGVENQSELSVLRENGFEMAQGFVFHKPMSSDRILELLHPQSAAPKRSADSKHQVA